MTVSARVGIRSKLTIMVLGPVIVLLAVLFTQISGRISVLNDVHELWELIPIVKQTSDLVHEIQTERGLSARFLSSGGTDFGDQLEEQYLRTDESAALLTKSLLHAVQDGEQFLEPLELHDGTPLLQASNPLDIFPNLENLDAHRANVRGLDSDELDSLIFYSSVNEGLLKLVPELTRWSPDAEIVSPIWAYNSLAKATESAGLERAVLGHAIAAGRLSRDGLARLSRLIGSQNAHLDVFLHHATPELRELYQEKLSYPPTPGGLLQNHASSNIIAFRETALSDNLSDLNAREWWMTATLRIDALDDLETLLLEDIVAKNLLLRTAARVNLAQFVMIGLLALVGLVVAWALGGQLARRARSLTVVATAISNGDLDQRADPGGRDEFGILGRAFNDMADHLTKLISGRDQFIATVSHELRTPLTTLVGYSELLRDEVSGFSAEERVEMVGAIAREASELDSLIQDLLVATRSADGSLVVVEVPVNLKAQATQVIESLESEQSTGITLVGKSAQATGDPMRVRQILRNLISNAIKYGGSHIEVRIHDKQKVSVLVTDDGQGIDAEGLDLIFEPYETLRNAGAIPGSMGLGLAVSRTLARLMGGELTYRYEGGECLFELTLPAWRSVDPEVESASVARSPESSEALHDRRTPHDAQQRVVDR